MFYFPSPESFERDRFLCSGDVFKKETQKILSFFKCEEGNEMENLKGFS